VALQSNTQDSRCLDNNVKIEQKLAAHILKLNEIIHDQRI